MPVPNPTAYDPGALLDEHGPRLALAIAKAVPAALTLASPEAIAFLAAARLRSRISNFDPARPLFPYFRAVAINLAKTMVRSWGRITREVPLGDGAADLVEWSSPYEHGLSATDAPSAVVQAVNQYLATLGPDDRAIAGAYLQNGGGAYAYAGELARELGLSRAEIKKRWQRMQRRLKRKLVADGLGPDG